MSEPGAASAVVRLGPRILLTRSDGDSLPLNPAGERCAAVYRIAFRPRALAAVPDRRDELRGLTEEHTPSEIQVDSAIETHLIVTPARNEAANLQRLGQCLFEQTWRPDAWIVVDNGSTDGTQDVVRELGRVHDWIRLVSIPSDENPARGRSSVRAFNAGVMGEPAHADFVTGLDADVSFGPEYLDSLRREFQRNSRLGIASGLCYEPSGDGWEPVHVTHPNLRGASLTYRSECLAQLLPLEVRLGWEAIGVVRARIRGWETAIISNLRYLPSSAYRCSGCQPVRELRGRRRYRLLHVVSRLIHAPANAVPCDRRSRSRGCRSRVGLRTLSSQSEAEASRGRLSRVHSFESVFPRTGCHGLARRKGERLTPQADSTWWRRSITTSHSGETSRDESRERLEVGSATRAPVQQCDAAK